MSCCTSQFDTVRKFVESRKLPTETLVWISPNDPFRKDTYINCNSTIPYTVEEFKVMYESDTIKFSGEISENHYEQILIGLHKRTMIDRELKQVIPLPESL